MNIIIFYQKIKGFKTMSDMNGKELGCVSIIKSSMIEMYIDW